MKNFKKYLTESKLTQKKAWNVVMKMVGDMDGKKNVEDVGQKVENGKKVHEFMVRDDYEEFIFHITLINPLNNKRR